MEHLPDLGDVALGDPLQRGNEMQNSVIGELVIGKFARTPCCDQPSAPQMLEMLRRIGHRQAGALGEDFDAALALGNLLQQFETVGMAKRLGDDGKLREQRLLRVLAFHHVHEIIQFNT